MINTKKTIIFLVLSYILFFSNDALSQAVNPLIHSSRNNSVKVIAPEIKSSGTGFFLDSKHIATCFHVIAAISRDPKAQQVNLVVAKEIKVVLANGEIFEAECITMPSEKDIAPLQFDFAVLRLKNVPKITIKPNPLYKEKKLPAIGSNILFSGYPLDAPAMLTHKGYISGAAFDESIICIEAPINKGSSGSALLSEKGEVLGIISSREGGLSQNLNELTKLIDAAGGGSGISFGPVDPVFVNREIIRTLDQYISTGIGYAHSISFLKEYLNKNPELLKK